MSQLYWPSLAQMLQEDVSLVLWTELPQTLNATDQVHLSQFEQYVQKIVNANPEQIILAVDVHTPRGRRHRGRVIFFALG